MRLLQVNSLLPLPPDSGIRLIEHNLLRLQAEQHDVTYLCLVQSKEQERRLKTLSELCRVVPVRMKNSYSPVHRVGYRLGLTAVSFTTRRPLTSLYVCQHALRQALTRELHRSYDAVEFHGSPLAAAVADCGGFRTVLYLYDLEFRLLAQRASVAGRPLTRKFGELQSAYTRSYEHHWLPRFDRILAVQEDERSYIRDVLGLEAGRMPVALESPPDALRADTQDPRLVVFVGVMNYHPNVDAVLYFARDVWPKVRERVPGARFVVVGHSPTASVARLDGVDGIEVTGAVEAVSPYISRAACCVLPMRLGTGIKVKLLEYMSLGKAVVSTPRGVTGISVKAGADVLVSNGEDEELAAMVAHVLSDERRRRELEGSARRFAEENYSLAAARRQLRSHYERLEQLTPAAGGTTS